MFLFLILLAIFALVSLILPWIQMGKIDGLKREIREIKKQLSNQNHEVKIAETPKIITPQPEIKVTPQVIKPIPQPQKIKTPEISFEQRFGARLPVWIGGIALALSGLFLVKYSIEIGILTQNMRLALGTIFGFGLLGLGNWIHKNNKIANSARISQTLVGAGIVVLYICSYVATSIYQILPSFAGLVAMTCITAIAIFMSFNLGSAIAIFGIIGGFLTPGLVSSEEPSSMILFSYLYLLFTGLLLVIRKQNKWIITIPLIIGTFLWVVIWIITKLSPNDTIWLGLFLIAICATVSTITNQAIENGEVDKEQTFHLSTIISYFTFGGSTALLAMIVKQNNFGILELGFFGILSFGSIFLAYFKQRIYGFIPLITAAFSGFILFSNNLTSLELSSAILAFATLFVISGYFAMWKSENPKLWAILITATSFGYYLIGYYKIYFNSPEPAKNFWVIIALILAALSVRLAYRIRLTFKNDEAASQNLLAIFALSASAFLSVAFFTMLESKFLPVFFAVQILAISWINNKVKVDALKNIAQINGVIFAILTLPEIFFLSSEGSIFYLGLPAIAIFISSQLFAKKQDDEFVKCLEISSIILAVIAAYIGLTIDVQSEVEFFRSAIFTDLLCIYALFCLWFSNKFKRHTIQLSANVIFSLVILVTFICNLLILNPFWSHQLVGKFPIFNSLILAYLIPVAALIFANSRNKDQKLKYIKPLSFISLFAFISLNIRQFFHGEYLDSSLPMTLAEKCSYSAAWLVSGIALLLFGTKLKNKNIRLAALGLILTASCKIFLFDASGLSGLYRVFSFMGLGIVLIGLSWFYTKFISDKDSK
jgi:uncharacterized membrane protein